jgi:hypothetical protein
VVMVMVDATHGHTSASNRGPKNLEFISHAGFDRSSPNRLERFQAF